MPYAIHWEPQGVYKTFHGLVTGAELLQSVQEVAADPRFERLRFEISDYLGAEGTDYSQDALNDVRATRIGSYQTNPRVKVAIITRDPDIENRIYSTVAARLTLHQTRVFPDLASANVWLGRSA